MIELTAEQRLELNTDSPRAFDPETRTKYVLVKEDVFERIEALLVPDRLTIAEQKTALHAAGLRAGWDDPEMDVYDREQPLLLQQKSSSLCGIAFQGQSKLSKTRLVADLEVRSAMKHAFPLSHPILRMPR